MTFLAFYEAVAANVWPERPARNLVRTYKDWVRDALIQLQVRVVQGALKPLQEKHVEVVGQDDMFFSCGAHVWRMPRGTVVEVRTEAIPNRCDIVIARPVSEREFRCLLENNPTCGCSTTSCSTDSFPYGYDTITGEDEDYYYGSVWAPVGGTVSQPQWTSEPNRPRERFYALIDGHIWLWPELHSAEVMVVTWKGVKRSWPENAEFGLQWLDEAGGFDREVQEAVEEFCKAKDVWLKTCDKGGQLDFTMFNDRVAGLISSRRNENTTTYAAHHCA
jgi:hypothetical protein